MALAPQTIALLHAARLLHDQLPADAILLLPEVQLDWDAVVAILGDCRALVAGPGGHLNEQLQSYPQLIALDFDPGPSPREEHVSLALLEAVRSERLHHGADVVVVHNGVDTGTENVEQLDSVGVVHLGEHLDRLNAQDLRKLDTQVPLEVLRAVVDLATEIGREGREGKPVGTMFIVGDTRKVLSKARAMNFNPFRGYSREERDIRDPVVREQIKDLAQLEGAIIIRRDGIAVAACMRVYAEDEEITLSMGLGTRHAAAAAISKATKAIAVAVSQSSGAMRLFQNGEVMLHIEPSLRPRVWSHPSGQRERAPRTSANGQKLITPGRERTPT